MLWLWLLLTLRLWLLLKSWLIISHQLPNPHSQVCSSVWSICTRLFKSMSMQLFR